MNDNSGTWSGILTNAFFAGAGAASANLLANVTWRDSYGRLDWRETVVYLKGGLLKR